MKKADCGIFREEMLQSGKNWSPALEEHLRNCEECASLCRTLRTLPPGCGEMDVPERLDRAILLQAKVCRRRRSISRLVFRRIIPGFSAAAAAAVICMIALTPGGEKEEREVLLAEASLPADWSTIEGDAFDLNQELTSCQHSLANWQQSTEGGVF